MKSDFEQSMREGMKGASLNELMPEFDKQAEWNQLSGKLRPEKKRILMPIWSYAAGIVALILAGWFCTKHHTPEKTLVKNTPVQAPVPPPINEPQPTNQVPALVPHSVSAPVVKQTTVAANEPKIKRQGRIKTANQSIPIGDTGLLFSVHLQPGPTQLMITDSTIIFPAQSQPKTITAAVKKTRPHAVNVLDIDNEDRQFMITEAPVGTYANPFLAKLHSVITQDAIAGSDRYYPLQGAFKK
jgi:hypothetical protein